MFQCNLVILFGQIKCSFQKVTVIWLQILGCEKTDFTRCIFLCMILGKYLMHSNSPEPPATCFKVIKIFILPFLILFSVWNKGNPPHTVPNNWNSEDDTQENDAVCKVNKDGDWTMTFSITGISLSLFTRSGKFYMTMRDYDGMVLWRDKAWRQCTQ